MAQPLDVVLVFSGDASKAVQAVNQLSGKIGALTQAVVRTNKQGAAGFATMSTALGSLKQGLQGTVDGFRLVSQGVMSIGRALTFFISLPLSIFLRNATQEAMTFEEQMVRVRKTTGLAATAAEDAVNNMQALTEEMRNMARTAPTSHEQLGIMAEQAGQLGIRTVEGITTFVRWMEILATSTNISAEEVVGTMGKIAAAFKWSADDSADNIIRLANVMNILENTTAATAAEIADALFRFAPQAKQLGIAAADAAALSAALVSLGVSSESTGTRLGNMFIKLTQNADQFAELASNTDKYATRVDVLNAIHEDAVGVLFDLIEMMEGTDNRAEALAESFDLVGLRGGRALGTLAGNSDLLSGSLERARREWEEATSLLTEYNIALESAQNHMQIMKNNITDVGIEFGQTLLPAINDLIEFAVPALRMLGEAVRALSREQKLWIAAAAVGVVVLGPLLFLVSQIAFGFFMMGLGLIKMVMALGAVIKGVVALIGVLAGLGSTVWIAVGAVIGGIILLRTVFKEQAQKIAQFFSRLAQSAASWGENLSAEIANGLIAGAVKFIAAALTFIGNLIASFLEAKSPPDLGPLAHIDKWGKTLFDTYLRGMEKADFGILRTIGRTIANIFKNFALIGKIGESDQFVFLLEARQNLAKLLNIWRETGKISESVLNDIVKNLGEAADEVKELIRLNIKLLEAEQALVNLRKAREDFIEQNREEIRQAALSGKTAEERVAIIRRLLRARDQGLRQFDEEEKRLEEERDLAKEQLDTQKAMIDAMQEQDDIQARLIKALEKAAGAMEDAFKFPEVSGAGTGLPDMETLLGEIGEPIIELELRFKSKQGVLQGFLDGLLKGLDLSAMSPEQMQEMFGVSDEDMGMLLRMNQLGLELHNTWDGLKSRIDNLRDGISNFFNLFSGGEGGLFEGLQIPPEVQHNWAIFVGWLLTAWELIKSSVIAAVETIRPQLERLGEVIGLQRVKWDEVLNFILGAVAVIVGTIIQILAWLVTGAIVFITGFASAFVGGITRALEFGVEVFSWAFSFIDAIVAGWKQMFEGGWQNFWQGITTFLGGILGLIVGLISGAVATILGFIIGFVEGAVQWFMNLWNQLVGNSIIPDMLQAIQDSFTTVFDSIMTWLGGWFESLWGNLLTWGQTMLDKLAEGIRKGIEEVAGAFEELVSRARSVLQPLIDFIQKILDFVRNPPSFPEINFPSINIPGLATGGIVYRTTFAQIGEVPEAIVPLDRLPKIMAEAMGMVGGSGIWDRAGKIEVNFNNPVVRDDEDMQRLIDTVEKVLADKVRTASAYGGVLDI